MLKLAELAEDGVHKLRGHLLFQGLKVAIENRKGDVRKGVSRDGHKWRTVMKFPYGYVEDSKGKDGEGVDVYIGPNKDADTAFVVHQHKPDGTGFDEDKVMLGFDDLKAAKDAYLAQYDDPKFLGPVSAVSMVKLKELLGSGQKLPRITEQTKVSEVLLEAFYDELKKIAHSGSLLVERSS